MKPTTAPPVATPSVSPAAYVQGGWKNDTTAVRRTTQNSSLPVTGLPSGLMAVFAALMILSGLGMLFAGRRRNRRRPASSSPYSNW